LRKVILSNKDYEQEEKRMKRRQAGFSLTELMIVVVILAILAAMLYPVFVVTKQKAKETSSAQNLRNLFLATTLYRQDQESNLEYGSPAEMGLPLGPGYIELYQKVVGKNSRAQSPCGRHPRLNEGPIPLATIYYYPLNASFKVNSRRLEDQTPLWGDPNCNMPSVAIRQAKSDKILIAVTLGGQVKRSESSLKPFYSETFFSSSDLTSPGQL
jgi:prepilin-type N-terminal cleavage/methylation domain-containing protein